MALLKKKYKYFLVLLSLSGLLSSCIGTLYMKENQKLLYRQSIKSPKDFTLEGMNSLYTQKVNSKVLGLPINYLVWMHHAGEKVYDKQKFIDKKEIKTKKFDRKIERANDPRKKASLQYRKLRKIDLINAKIENGNHFMQWGEPPAVFDTAQVKATTDKINNFLFTKGYFQGKAFSEVKEYKRRVGVVYNLDPGRGYYIDTLSSDIQDSVVAKLYFQHQNESLLKKGDRFDQDKISQERERIDLLMKDNGYYDFSRQYIHFDIDTAYHHQHTIAVRTEIRNPTKQDFHKLFSIDSINFTTDAGVTPKNKDDERKRNLVDAINFHYFKHEYSNKILSQRVFLDPDNPYSRTKTFSTQRQLANLDIFKFVNINYDTSGGKFVANIFASPLDRFSWSNEAGLTVSQGFPGPYLSTNLKKRNLFGGLEIFEIGGRFGFEGVAAATSTGNFYKSTEASANTSITFPQFLFPFKAVTAKGFGKYNPRTKMLAGYSYTDRPEYNRSITTFSHTYNWENSHRTQYSFTLANLNIIRSTLAPAFDSLLLSLQQNQGNNLINTFKPSFVSSMIFGITWNPKNYGNTQKSSYYIRVQAESGGTFFSLYTPGVIAKEGLQVYQYVRLNADLRRNEIIDKNTILGYRLNMGVGYSYNSNRVLPYEKYFFAGGSNSIRAWRPRRLGIGSAPPALASNPENDGLFDYKYERPGEILLEGSIELRQKLFGFVSGAVFVDAGNVWLFRQTTVAPSSEPTQATWTGNTKFRLDQFYKEIAVGTGFGLRFDFSFLVLRFDVGIKAYDPGRKEGDRFILNKARFFKPFSTEREPVIFNIGIGYPF